MEEKHVDLLLVAGAMDHNSDMVFLTGIHHVGEALLFKMKGKEPFILHNPMEREEAAKSGYQSISYSDYRLLDLLKENKGNYPLTYATVVERILVDHGFTGGKTALFGKVNIDGYLSIIRELEKRIPGMEIIEYSEESILSEAMFTKSREQVDQIREMGLVTTRVVGQVAQLLQTSPVKGDVLKKPDGSSLRIQDIKRKINLWLAEQGAENPEGTIFSIGRDAGIGHSAGNPEDELRLGQTIVFDIYPCQAGGGYFYDFTRTWSLGYASDAVVKLYDQVSYVYKTLIAELKAGSLCKDYQERTCELFEEMGHPTIRQDSTTESGYNHSLGHGIGLNVHERPWFSTIMPTKDRIVPGSVFTIEPGLYYPEKGMGARIEDSYWCDESGHIEILADFPYDLVLPVNR
jgi:Xaa-Pro aminopeptidase